MITCVYKYGLCLHDLSNSFNGPYPPDEVEMWRNKAKVFEEEYKFPYSEKLFSRPIMVITMPVQIRIDMAIVRYKHKLRLEILNCFQEKNPIEIVKYSAKQNRPCNTLQYWTLCSLDLPQVTVYGILWILPNQQIRYPGFL